MLYFYLNLNLYLLRYTYKIKGIDTMIKKDVVIIGAGPAGLFTVINIDGKKLDTVILERNSVAGKKLLISGGGQCNITHSGNISDFLEKYGDKKRYLRNTLYGFTNEDLVEFFRKKGLEMEIKNQERYFQKPEKLKMF